MITFERDGVRMNVESEIQASAFALSGWKRVEVAEKTESVELKPKTTRTAKK
jgi:hypothetical protein